VSEARTGPPERRKNFHLALPRAPNRHPNPTQHANDHLPHRRLSPIHIIMSLAASRAVLRHTTFAARRAGIRNASSTSEATAAAKQKTSDAAASAKDKASDAAAAAKQRAAEFQSKASEGLSRVSSSAGAALSKAGSALGNSAEALSKAGGRTGQVAGTVQC
jgi:hypothetical protein